MSEKWAMGLVVAFFSAFIAACGGADVGEACETEGAADECVEDAICGKRSDTSAEPQCLKVCKADSDCASGETCNGVTGSSTKACRVK